MPIWSEGTRHTTRTHTHTRRVRRIDLLIIDLLIIDLLIDLSCFLSTATHQALYRDIDLSMCLQITGKKKLGPRVKELIWLAFQRGSSADLDEKSFARFLASYGDPTNCVQNRASPVLLQSELYRVYLSNKLTSQSWRLRIFFRTCWQAIRYALLYKTAW